MKILFVGPGLLPIPPQGWGGIEHLVWDMNLALKELGHDVKLSLIHISEPTRPY